MTLDGFIKMLAEVNDTSGLNKNNIVERIKTKLERSDLWKWEDSRFNINHIFATHSDPDPVETTLLHFSAKSGYENIVRALIAYGAYVNAWDSDGCTPLHFAAEGGNESIVRTLIACGAHVNAQNNDRNTPLHFAIEGGSENIVRTLIKNGACVNIWDSDRSTPLHFATRGGNENIVRILIEHEAYVDEWDSDRSTPLHIAARGGNENIVRILVENGACVESWDNRGRTPLHLAIDHKGVRDILIESGSYISKQGYAPLHFAIEWGCKDVISFSSSNTDSRAKMEVERVDQITPAKRLRLF